MDLCLPYNFEIKDKIDKGIFKEFISIIFPFGLQVIIEDIYDEIPIDALIPYFSRRISLLLLRQLIMLA